MIDLGQMEELNCPECGHPLFAIPIDGDSQRHTFQGCRCGREHFVFGSILQDVAERWNTTNRTILISELETCLALTESSCAVPTPFIIAVAASSADFLTTTAAPRSA
jgi:hypothetical protein